MVNAIQTHAGVMSGTAVAWARARRKSDITSIVVWFASDSEKNGNEVGNDQDTCG
jgi:hypothetical protein